MAAKKGRKRGKKKDKETQKEKERGEGKVRAFHFLAAEVHGGARFSSST